ncbi:S1 RNA-binding domain-containing protein, partial [Pseudomonadota bacterium]
TEAEIDIDDDGKVFISSTDDAAIAKAKQWVTDLVREVQMGEEFTGKVVRVESYGAFVNILPGRDGLVHVSNMSTEYVSDVNTLVKLGDEVKVRVAEIDDAGKIGLSMLTAEQEAQKKQSGGGRPGGGNHRSGGFRGGQDRRGGRDHRGGSDRRDSRDRRPRR